MPPESPAADKADIIRFCLIDCENILRTAHSAQLDFCFLRHRCLLSPSFRLTQEFRHPACFGEALFPASPDSVVALAPVKLQFQFFFSGFNHGIYSKEAPAPVPSSPDSVMALAPQNLQLPLLIAAAHQRLPDQYRIRAVFPENPDILRRADSAL